MTHSNSSSIAAKSKLMVIADLPVGVHSQTRVEVEATAITSSDDEPSGAFAVVFNRAPNSQRVGVAALQSDGKHYCFVSVPVNQFDLALTASNLIEAMLVPPAFLISGEKIVEGLTEHFPLSAYDLAKIKTLGELYIHSHGNRIAAKSKEVWSSLKRSENGYCYSDLLEGCQIRFFSDHILIVNGQNDDSALYFKSTDELLVYLVLLSNQTPNQAQPG